MATTTLNIQGVITGLLEGARNLSPATITNGSAPDRVDSVTISGSTTLAPPSGAVGALIVPPAGNVTTITLKGSPGDTGVQLHPTNPTLLGVSGGGTINLTFGGVTATLVTVLWF